MRGMLIFFAGFGLGSFLTAILAIIIIKVILDSKLANTPDTQKILGCLHQCSAKGFVFGSPEYDDCVNGCLSQKRNTE
jgi:hypothetical protein